MQLKRSKRMEPPVEVLGRQAADYLSPGLVDLNHSGKIEDRYTRSLGADSPGFFESFVGPRLTQYSSLQTMVAPEFMLIYRIGTLEEAPSALGGTVWRTGESRSSWAAWPRKEPAPRPVLSPPVEAGAMSYSPDIPPRKPRSLEARQTPEGEVSPADVMRMVGGVKGGTGRAEVMEEGAVRQIMRHFKMEGGAMGPSSEHKALRIRHPKIEELEIRRVHAAEQSGKPQQGGTGFEEGSEVRARAAPDVPSQTESEEKPDSHRGDQRAVPDKVLRELAEKEPTITDKRAPRKTVDRTKAETSTKGEPLRSKSVRIRRPKIEDLRVTQVSKEGEPTKHEEPVAKSEEYAAAHAEDAAGLSPEPPSVRLTDSSAWHEADLPERVFWQHPQEPTAKEVSRTQPAATGSPVRPTGKEVKGMAQTSTDQRKSASVRESDIPLLSKPTLGEKPSRAFRGQTLTPSEKDVQTRESNFWQRILFRGERQPPVLNMEHFLGIETGEVRIHKHAAAGKLAEGVHADAFTAGSDIYFAPGKFKPDTPEGAALLAHELTHVAQQRAVTGAKSGRMEQQALQSERLIASTLRYSGGSFALPPMVYSATPAIQPQTAVQRADEGRAGAGDAGAASPPALTPPTPSQEAIDYDLLADRVYDLIEHRLMIERERRGGYEP